MKVEVKSGVTYTQAKEHLPEAARSKQILPKHLWREHSSAYTLILDFVLQNKFLFFLRPSIFGYLL